MFHETLEIMLPMGIDGSNELESKEQSYSLGSVTDDFCSCTCITSLLCPCFSFSVSYRMRPSVQNWVISMELSDSPQLQSKSITMHTEFGVLPKKRMRNEKHFPNQFLTIRRMFTSILYNCNHRTSRNQEQLQSTSRTLPLEIKTVLAKQGGGYIISE